MPPLVSLCLGFLLDQLLGDPPGWPHPVRAIGRFIQFLEPRLRRLSAEKIGGVALLLLVLATVGGLTWAALAAAELCHPWARTGLATILIYYGLAARSLTQETEAVLQPCEKGDWSEARRRLGFIVGRDTHDLPAEDIYRACIETVAENTSDGVVAPLFYLVVAGPVGMWLYKAVNTLDSMVGYRSPRYLHFGWASARVDDLLNYVPGRLTWLLLALAAGLSGRHGGQALRVGWRDGRKHPSPNSAWSEAAMAGALGIQLGGPSTYQGVLSRKPLLGKPGPPLDQARVRQALRVMQVAAWLTFLIAALIVWSVGEWPLVPTPRVGT